MYEKRLIAFLVSFFVIGVIVGISLNDGNARNFAVLFAIIAVSSVVILVIVTRTNKISLSKYITAAVISVAALSFGALSIFVKDAFNTAKSYDKKEDIASIVITDISNTHIDGKIKESQIEVPKNTAVRLYVYGCDEELLIGDTVTCELKYNFKNDNSLKSKGISLTSSANILNIQKGRGILYSIRKSVDKNSELLFSEFENIPGISKGVTIGDRTDINSYVFAIYRNAGISHLLAISGLHISIIVLSFYYFLLLIFVNRKVAGFLSVIVAFMFAALTGFSVGALRSVIMISVVLLSGMFLEQYDSFTTLFGTLFIFLVINPYSLCSIGLQLSFLCCLGLLLVSPLTSKMSFSISELMIKANLYKRLFLKLTSAIAIPLLTSTVAAVFSFPVTYINFNSTSSISPLINVFAVPLFTIAIELSVISYLIAPFSVPVASLFSYPAGFLFRFVTNISETVYDLNLGIVSTHTRIFIIPLIISIIAISILTFSDKDKGWKSVAVCVIFGLSIFVCGYINKTNANRVNVIEYGCDQGEYIFCSTEGANSYIDLGGYTVYPLVVYETGNMKLDNYVVLKYNSQTYRHIEYMTSEIRVKNIVLPLPKKETDFYFSEQIKILANDRKCDIIYFDKDYIARLSSDVGFEVIGNEEDINEEICVYIKFGKTTVQFLGDGFYGPAVCDYAIISKEAEVDFRDIDAKTICSQNEFLEKHKSDRYKTLTFQERLKFEINTKESDCRVYEP